MSSRAPSIRDATPDDAPAMADVQVRSWRAGYAGVVPRAHLDGLSVEARTLVTRRWLTGEGIPLVLAPVALIGDRVVGMSGWTSGFGGAPAGTAQLASLYVAPEAWRSGAGRGMLDDAVARLPGMGFDRATLYVLADNERGRAFYEAMGWAHDGTSIVDDIGGARLEELRYARDLG